MLLRRLPYLPDHRPLSGFFLKKDACFFEIPKERRLCLRYSKCRKIGGHCPSDVEWRAQMTPAFFLQTKKGHGFSRFSGKRNAVCYACRSCGPTSAPQVCPFFLPLIYPPTRSTLRDNRIQRELWGSYTIFTLRTAKKGLSAPVSAANTCHSYYCKEKKAHSLYNYQVIYIFLLCIKYLLSCILNI